MKRLLVIQGLQSPDDLDRFSKYYSFLKWLKNNYTDIFLMYGEHFRIPGENLQITAALDYIEPADRESVLNALIKFNALASE